MDKAPQIILRDPSELLVHPALRNLPGWSNDDPDFTAFIADVEARGIDDPLMIVGNKVVNGRHRLKAAKRLQMKLVPCIERREDEISGIILNSLVQRRHYNKGALAYLSFPLMEDAYEEAKARHQAYLRRDKSAASALLPKSAAELAETIGISRRLFFQAKELHEIFEKKPKLREQYEPAILSGEIGLGAVKAGIAGEEATKDKPKPPSHQFELFTEAFDTVQKRFHYWDKFNDLERDKVRTTIQKTVSAMPSDLRDEWKKAFRAIEKEEKNS